MGVSVLDMCVVYVFFFFQAEDGIRDYKVTGVQTCALPISGSSHLQDLSIGVGGLAAYLYVEEAEPDAGRLPKDIDIVGRRADLENIAKAAAAFGLQHCHVAGVDMLVRPDQPSGRRAVHLYPEATPELGPYRRIRELRLIPLVDLIHMKLTSFRLKDQTHLKDLDEAGLITPDMEAGLSPILAERLARTRARG